MLNPVGMGKRLVQDDIGDVARTIGITTSVMLAIIEVEAAGRGFDAQNRVTILNEGQVFHRELQGAQRTRAVNEGLAWPRWGDKPYPRSFDGRWEWVFKAIKINKLAALNSCSQGLGQTMGFNHAVCGFSNSQQMLEAYKQGEREQLFGMAGFIVGNNLVRHLVGKDFSNANSWRGFARGYNGTGYEKNNYHVKLRNAWMKHEKRKTEYEVPATRPVVLVKGMKSELVRNVQADLAFIGYKFDLGIDGRFGPETERNVKMFQTQNSLTVDGKVGPKTLEAIAKAVKAVQDVPPSQDVGKEVVVEKEKSIWQALLEMLLALFRAR